MEISAWGRQNILFSSGCAGGLQQVVRCLWWVSEFEDYHIMSNAVAYSCDLTPGVSRAVK